MQRRDFLKAASVLPLTALPPLRAMAQWPGPVAPALGGPDVLPAVTRLAPAPQSIEPFWNYPRALYMHNVMTKETVKAVYWENNQISPEGYRQLCVLLRDVHTGTVALIDPRLLDLMCAIQAWVAAYGFLQPIMVHSGYRTLETNDRTEGAQRNSRHLQAKAIDFDLPGLPWYYLNALAKHYAGGGVGFYPAKNFIHTDTGPIRTWHGAW